MYINPIIEDDVTICYAHCIPSVTIMKLFESVASYIGC